MGEETESKPAIDRVRTGTVIDVVTIKDWSGNSSLGKSKRTANRPVGPSPVNETGAKRGLGTSSHPPGGGTIPSGSEETELATDGWETNKTGTPPVVVVAGKASKLGDRGATRTGTVS
jgi:hypothetical protein